MEVVTEALPQLALIVLSVTLLIVMVVVGRELLLKNHTNERNRDGKQAVHDEKISVLSRMNKVDMLIIKYKKFPKDSNRTPFLVEEENQTLVEIAALLCLPVETVRTIVEHFYSIGEFLKASDNYAIRILNINKSEFEEYKRHIWRQLDPTNISGSIRTEQTSQR